MRIGTPILLGRDMHAFSERLADIQRSEAL
jgi:hypothetical protein